MTNKKKYNFHFAFPFTVFVSLLSMLDMYEWGKNILTL